MTGEGDIQEPGAGVVFKHIGNTYRWHCLPIAFLSASELSTAAVIAAGVEFIAPLLVGSPTNLILLVPNG